MLQEEANALAAITRNSKRERINLLYILDKSNRKRLRLGKSNRRKINLSKLSSIFPSNRKAPPFQRFSNKILLYDKT